MKRWKQNAVDRYGNLFNASTGPLVYLHLFYFPSSPAWLSFAASLSILCIFCRTSYETFKLRVRNWQKFLDFINDLYSFLLLFWEVRLQVAIVYRNLFVHLSRWFCITLYLPRLSEGTKLMGRGRSDVECWTYLTSKWRPILLRSLRLVLSVVLFFFSFIDIIIVYGNLSPTFACHQ